MSYEVIDKMFKLLFFIVCCVILMSMLGSCDKSDKEKVESLNNVIDRAQCEQKILVTHDMVPGSSDDGEYVVFDEFGVKTTFNVGDFAKDSCFLRHN